VPTLYDEVVRRIDATIERLMSDLIETQSAIPDTRSEQVFLRYREHRLSVIADRIEAEREGNERFLTFLNQEYREGDPDVENSVRALAGPRIDD
jgi:hypothetical protein